LTKNPVMIPFLTGDNFTNTSDLEYFFDILALWIVALVVSDAAARFFRPCFLLRYSDIIIHLFRFFAVA
jgi:hypothetical protein